MRYFTPSKNPDILNAKLATTFVSALDYKKGTVWKLGLEYRLEAEPALVSYLQDHASAKAVVSFQHYPNQENVAVARLHRELIK